MAARYRRPRVGSPRSPWPRKADHDRGHRRRGQDDARAWRWPTRSAPAGSTCGCCASPAGCTPPSGSAELVSDPELRSAPAPRRCCTRPRGPSSSTRRCGRCCAEGTWVLLDRFVDSSLAYQGGGRELGIDAVRDVNEFATGGLRPDRTLLLTIAPELGRSRSTERGRRRTASSASRRTSSSGRRRSTSELSAQDPDRIRTIDATASARAGARGRGRRAGRPAVSGARPELAGVAVRPRLRERPGVGDDLLEPGLVRLPPSSARISSLAATSIGGSPARRRPRASGSRRPVTLPTAAITSRTENPSAVPEVEDLVLAPTRVLEREQVRGGEIVDVDVVADARCRRASGSRSRRSRRTRPCARRGPQHVGDQVRLGLVVLSQVAAGPGHVEVPQAHRPEPVRRAEVGDHPVDGELRRAVRALRAGRRQLGDRHLVGLAVDRAGRGEHQPRRAAGVASPRAG